MEDTKQYVMNEHHEHPGLQCPYIGDTNCKLAYGSACGSLGALYERSLFHKSCRRDASPCDILAHACHTLFLRGISYHTSHTGTKYQCTSFCGCYAAIHNETLQHNGHIWKVSLLCGSGSGQSINIWFWWLLGTLSRCIHQGIGCPFLSILHLAFCRAWIFS